MFSRSIGGFVFVAALAAAGCSSSNPSQPGPPIPTTAPTAAPTVAPTSAASAQPQVVHVGFTHATSTDPKFGEIAYYSPTAGAAAIVTVKAGSQIVFTNDGSGVPHTASGLGQNGFPSAFDNTSGPTASGSAIDGGTTWSSGNLNPGQTSTAFTVGPAGTYFFGCAYHFPDSPSMRDVIVAT